MVAALVRTSLALKIGRGISARGKVAEDRMSIASGVNKPQPPNQRLLGTMWGSLAGRWLDQSTGTPVRHHERAALSELPHADVKKLGQIPDGYEVLGRAAGRKDPIRRRPQLLAHRHLRSPPPQRDPGV